MSEKILVPVLGESITEATVAKWLKNKGDDIKIDEPIIELETDKVNLEVPSAVNGILTEINAKDGDVVKVGAVLGSINENDHESVEKEIKPLLNLIKSLSNTGNFDLVLKKIKPDNSAVAVCKSLELYIPLGELVDKDEEIAKLNKRLNELDSLIESIENKLSNDEFVSKAPENIVDGEKNKLNDFSIERTKILSNIEVLK